MSAATGGFNTSTVSISGAGQLRDGGAFAALVGGIEQLAAWKLGLFHRDPTGTTALGLRRRRHRQAGRSASP